MSDAPSDALVFFGATGDLAYKQIFPALQGLVRDEGIDIPIVGVAKSGWGLDQFRARAKDSLQHHGSFDEAAFARLLRAAELCRRRLQRSSDVPAGEAGARIGAAAAALSGDPAGAVRRGRVGARRGGLEQERATGGREAVRPRPRVGAGAEQDAARAFSRRGDLPHRPLSRQGAGPEHRLHALRQRNVRTAVEPPIRSRHPDHHGGILRRGRPRRLLRRHGRAARRRSEPHAAGCRELDDGSADRRGVRGLARSEGGADEGGPPARQGQPRARAISWLPKRSRSQARTRPSKPTSRSGSLSTAGDGRACRSISAPASACR